MWLGGGNKTLHATLGRFGQASQYTTIPHVSWKQSWVRGSTKALYIIKYNLISQLIFLAVYSVPSQHLVETQQGGFKKALLRVRVFDNKLLKTKSFQNSKIFLLYPPDPLPKSLSIFPTNPWGLSTGPPPFGDLGTTRVSALILPSLIQPPGLQIWTGSFTESPQNIREHSSCLNNRAEAPFTTNDPSLKIACIADSPLSGESLEGSEKPVPSFFVSPKQSASA